MACNCTGCSGLGAFGPVPPLAQHGFRLSIPGGPRGGQFHGRISANPTSLYYHGGRAHNLSGFESPVFGTAPHNYFYDPFHRAPGEVVPRPNASGDLNITHVPHFPKTPGYSMVPGGLFPVGGFGIGALPVVNPPSAAARACRQMMADQAAQAARCKQTRSIADCTFPLVMCDPNVQDGPMLQQPPGTTTVPAPGTPIAPAPVVADNCPAGMYRDAAGNCTSDWSHPYPISLPAQPSPTIPASTAGSPTAGQPGCVGGTYDAQGNCIPSSVPGATNNWFTDPSQEVISGVPNWVVAGGAAAALMLMMRGGGRR